MKITKLDSSRWQDYKKIRLESLVESPQSFLDTVEETEAQPESLWHERMQNVWFAVNDSDKVVGMLSWYREDKTKLSHIVNVVSFYVSPATRGQGVGRQLLQAVISEASAQDGVKKLQLGVITTQLAAQSLYTSIGFQKIGEQKMAVKVGDTFYDEFLMEKYL